MRKLLLSLILLTFTLSAGFSQVVSTVYYEDFEVLPVQGTQGIIGTSSPAIFNWDRTTIVSTSPTNSYFADIHIQTPAQSMSGGDTLYFETNTFSTIGNVFVLLEFDNIAKVRFTDQAVIQVSSDGGTTWQELDNNQYQGTDPLFASNFFFNGGSYFQDGQPWTTAGNNDPPTQTMWRHEVFEVSTLLANTANAKVRFVITPQSNTQPSAGWYIDNIEVKAAPCEIIPPVLTANTGNPGANPNNAVFVTGPFPIDYNASDAQSGIDSVYVVYKVNGGVTDTVQLTPQGANQYLDSIPAQSVFDTICYQVVAVDLSNPCQNKTVLPSDTSFYCFDIRAGLPPMCGAVGANPGNLEFVPWAEDFETNFSIPTPPTNNFGLIEAFWDRQPTNIPSRYTWIPFSGSTPTANTGPSADNTLKTPAGKYMYLESNQTTGNQGVLVTPCLDFSNIVSPKMTYWYYMYGADVGSISIDIGTDTNSTGTINWDANINGNSISGEKQTLGSDPWEQKSLSLWQYGNSDVPVVIRIRGAKGIFESAGGSSLQDLAIDDINIFEPPSFELEMNSIDAPIAGLCSYSANDSVTITFTNEGGAFLHSIPVSHTITGPSGPVTVNEVISFAPDSLEPGETYTYTFNTGVDMSTPGTYTINTCVNLTGDVDITNDCTTATYEVYLPITSFPFIEDFENSTRGNPANQNPGVLGPNLNGWELVPTASPTNDNYAFYVNQGITIDENSGPVYDHTLGTTKGQFLYAESNNSTSTLDVVARFESVCFDFSGMTSPHLDFYYHMYGSSVDRLVIQGKTDNMNGGNWFPIVAPALVGQKQTSKIEDWRYQSVDLSAFADSSLAIRFIARRTLTSDNSDIAIDDIHVYDRQAVDVGVSEIVNPFEYLRAGNVSNVQLRIRNFGTTPATNIPVTYSYDGVTGTAIYTGTIAPGADDLLSIPSNTIAAPVGRFDLCAWTTMTGDINTFNDSICRETFGFTRDTLTNYNNFRYVDGFDNGDTSLYQKSKIGDGLRQWELGAPTGPINSAISAPNVWEIDLDGNYRNDANEMLYAPILYVDTLEDIQFHFDQWMASEGGVDGGRVEYLGAGAIWVSLEGAASAVTQNWYDSKNPVSALGGNGFSGSTGGWIHSMYPLNFYNGNTSPLVTRFRFASDPATNNSDGWAIDNLGIIAPPQRSASPDSAYTISPLPIPGNNQFGLIIRNTGANDLDSVVVELYIDEAGPAPNTLVSTEAFSFKKIITNGTYEDTLSFVWDAPPGTHDVCFVTRFPNGLRDLLPEDDTLCIAVTILDTTSVFPSCTNFDGGATFLSRDAITYKPSNSWEWGVPGASIGPAFSPPNAWVTKLNSDYTRLEESALFTSVYNVDSGQCYRISFMHLFETELYHDGGLIEASQDGGVTWELVGSHGGNWYNTNFVTSLEQINPGWTGSSGGQWDSAFTDVSFQLSGPTIFRFRFGSDYTVEQPGWAIDDFCFDESPFAVSACNFIGLEEDILKDIFLGEITPNPSNGVSYLDYSLVDAGEVKFTVYNMMGQPLVSETVNASVGGNRYEINSTEWQSGIYFITFEYKGAALTRRMVVTK